MTSNFETLCFVFLFAYFLPILVVEFLWIQIRAKAYNKTIRSHGNRVFVLQQPDHRSANSASTVLKESFYSEVKNPQRLKQNCYNNNNMLCIPKVSSLNKIKLILNIHTMLNKKRAFYLSHRTFTSSVCVKSVIGSFLILPRGGPIDEKFKKFFMIFYLNSVLWPNGIKKNIYSNNLILFK